MNPSENPHPPRSPGFVGMAESLGNKLPHPFWLFLYLTIALAAFSFLASFSGLTVLHPLTGIEEDVRNLISREGIDWLLGSAIANVAQFRPLPLVLTMLVGIGLAERTGLFSDGIHWMMKGVRREWVPPAVILASILGNVASDVSYLILPPLGAAVFAAAGRPPLAGFCAALAGTGAGYTANFLVAGTDVLTAGISTQAAQILNPEWVVSPLCNWYFMCASVLLLTVLGSLLTTRWFEPRIAAMPGLADDAATGSTGASISNRPALLWAFAGGAGYAAIVAALAIPEGGLLHAAPGGDFSHSPFMRGIVPLLSLGFALMGILYGVRAGVIKKMADVPRLIAEAVREMSGFFVIAVVIAQFLAAFQWTNAGLYLAVESAEAARAADFSGLPLLLTMIMITAVLSFFVSSSSSLWAMLAPVYVPMGMLLGYDPAVTQLAYRIAESSTNVVTPLTPYLIVLLPQLQRLLPKAGLGTMISLMVPYSLLFFSGWVLLFIAWHALGWPVGPGAPIHPSP